MLHPQIPKSWLGKVLPRRSLSFSTPIGGVSLGNAISGGLLEMLHDLEHYLEECDAVGSIDSPKDYVKGVVELKVGAPVDCSPIGTYSMAIWASPDVSIGLVGSTHHLIGGAQQTQAWWNASQLRHVLFFLDRLAEANLPTKRLADAGIVLPDGVLDSDRDWLTGKTNNWNVASYCRMLSYLVHPAPAQKYEILARVLLTSEDRSSPAVLATPVFVAGALSDLKDVEQDGAANGSQPIRSETNRTSSAAGSRR